MVDAADDMLIRICYKNPIEAVHRHTCRRVQFTSAGHGAENIGTATGFCLRPGGPESQAAKGQKKRQCGRDIYPGNNADIRRAWRENIHDAFRVREAEGR